MSTYVPGCPGGGPLPAGPDDNTEHIPGCPGGGPLPAGPDDDPAVLAAGGDHLAGRAQARRPRCVPHLGAIITIYAPMIYTAPCIMFWMRSYALQGQVGWGWALEFESLGFPSIS